ncbi:MAG: hypothetical protein ACRBCL_12515 [Maritimibacter sp.]
MGKPAQNLWTKAKTFGRDEHGAVTVDWVVLTATLIFMGIAVAFYMATAVPEVGDKVGDYMSEMTVGPE